MSEKRRALGRGLGALIPNAPTSPNGRPVDVFFPDQRPGATAYAGGSPAERDGDRRRRPQVAGTATATIEDSDRQRDAAATDAAAATTAQDGGHGGANGAVEDLTADDNPHGLAPVPGVSYGEIPVEQIRPNPRQPRSVFDEDEMAELVHSIREIGVLQPIVIRPIPAGQGPDQLDNAAEGVRYELIMGERRWRATQEAGKATVPAIVKETEDDDLLRDALLENLHRSQLNALEEAAAYQQLLEDFGCTHDELAARIGRSRPQISNTLRLLKLPPLVARRVAAGVLSAGHARALLGSAGRRRHGAGRPADRGRGAQRPQRRGDRRGRRPGRGGQAASPARRHPSPPARRPGGPVVRPVRHPGQHRPGPAQGQADRRVRLGRGPQPDRRPARRRPQRLTRPPGLAEQ